MTATDSLTTRQAGELLGQPEWRIRRVVDSLGNISRFGGKRMIPRHRLPDIIIAIGKQTADDKPQGGIDG